MVHTLRTQYNLKHNHKLSQLWMLGFGIMFIVHDFWENLISVF